MLTPMMSGHCSNPSPGSHDRCARMGAGNRARPSKEYQPCPCHCHYPCEEEQQYECEGCGEILVAAPHWPDEDAEAEGREPETVFTHFDPDTMRVTGFECNPKAVSRNASKQAASFNESEADEGLADEVLA